MLLSVCIHHGQYTKQAISATAVILLLCLLSSPSCAEGLSFKLTINRSYESKPTTTYKSADIQREFKRAQESLNSSHTKPPPSANPIEPGKLGDRSLIYVTESSASAYTAFSQENESSADFYDRMTEETKTKLLKIAKDFIKETRAHKGNPDVLAQLHLQKHQHIMVHAMAQALMDDESYSSSVDACTTSPSTWTKWKAQCFLEAANDLLKEVGVSGNTPLRKIFDNQWDHDEKNEVYHVRESFRFAVEDWIRSVMDRSLDESYDPSSSTWRAYSYMMSYLDSCLGALKEYMLNSLWRSNATLRVKGV